jgi:cAMP phosphodiesterase
MKIKVLGSFGSEGQGQRPSAFLVNDRILVDAGTVPGALGVEEQLDIDHALLSHPHLDHVVGLAFLTDTLAGAQAKKPVTATGVEPVIHALRTHAFNNVIWPDFTTIPSSDQPVLRFRTLAEEVEQRVGDLWVTPVPVDHTVPTTGFIIHDGEAGFIYSGDTGPTERIWRAARGLRGLRALIIECAFPNRLDGLAAASCHLTPALLRSELDKVSPDLQVLVFHIKPQFYQETAEELARIDSARIQILEQAKTYTF